MFYIKHINKKKSDSSKKAKNNFSPTCSDSLVLSSDALFYLTEAALRSFGRQDCVGLNVYSGARVNDLLTYLTY